MSLELPVCGKADEEAAWDAAGMVWKGLVDILKGAAPENVQKKKGAILDDASLGDSWSTRVL